MRFFPSLILAALIAAPGMALSAVRTGDEVSVNPLPAGGGNVLLYPGGQYMRVVQPLEQPGQTARDNGAIQLHMPGKRTLCTNSNCPVTSAGRSGRCAGVPSTIHSAGGLRLAAGSTFNSNFFPPTSSP